MGAVSSCCSAEPAENKELIGGANSEAPASRGGSIKSGGDNRAELEHPPKPPGATKTVSDVSLKHSIGLLHVCSQSEVENFQRRLETSMDVIVLLAVGFRFSYSSTCV